jgi:catechol 2,3-dioxygenase-like lactoylglutathione lyase family enzyme
MSEETRLHIIQLATIAVPVADQDRALAFYTGILGLQKRRDIPFGTGGRWIEVAPPEATTTIALVPSRPGVPTGVETGIRLTTEDATADHAYLRARGVDTDAAILRLGGPTPPMFSFRDPDGNNLLIVERM